MIFSRDKVRLLFTPQDAVVPDMKHVKIKKFLAENCPTFLWKSLGILFFILSEPFLFLPLNLSLKATFFIMLIPLLGKIDIRPIPSFSDLNASFGGL